MTTADTLASWTDGAARAAIVEFVRSVSEPGDSYVAPPERVATFDNDGTLWCEKPLYPQADFVFRRWKAMIKADPALAKEQPYKALAEGDSEWLGNVYAHVPELIKGVTAAYEGITVEAFETAVHEFFTAGRHPTLDAPYTKVTYRPMRELLAILGGSASSGSTSARPAAATSCGRSPSSSTASRGARDRLGDHARVPGWGTCTARPESSSPSDDGPGQAGPHLDSAPAASPCSPAAMPTATSRCWRPPVFSFAAYASRRRGARVCL